MDIVERKPTAEFNQPPMILGIPGTQSKALQKFPYIATIQRSRPGTYPFVQRPFGLPLIGIQQSVPDPDRKELRVPVIYLEIADIPVAVPGKPQKLSVFVLENHRRVTP